MALIKSISGIRGTIGGVPGQNLTPQDIVECTAAFGTWLLQKGNTPKVVIGRDARISGQMVRDLVLSTLTALGIDVIDLGLSTTPTVEMAVGFEGAGAGIIITASHNPKEWNALKFLNEKGEFISAADGAAVLDLITNGGIHYQSVDALGKVVAGGDFLQKHIQAIIDLPEVEVDLVRARGFKVVLDPVNSSGAITVPDLLEYLGCEVIVINGETNGQFAHNPEPLPEHLRDLSAAILEHRADLGIAVDPDVDRLALVCENGEAFGEEYTLVAVADYMLQHTPGNTVSNLSSSRALRDVTLKHGGQYFAAAVGEVNVVEKMKAVNARIGGEGNGGIIVPELHYGRDALVGIALFLSWLAKFGSTTSSLRATYPDYQMVKDKISLPEGLDMEAILHQLEQKYQHEEHSTIDGLKIDFPQSWLHLRKSNTEPIIRIYAEAPSLAEAEALVGKIKGEVLSLIA
jgi:phosphomannomutase